MYDSGLMERYVKLLQADDESEAEYASYMDSMEEPTWENFALMTLAGMTVKAGKSKLDKTRRISLINEIAEILEAESGDEIEYIVSMDGISIRKLSTPYKGYDIEQDLIDDNRTNYLLEKAITRLEDKIAEVGVKGSDYEKIREEYIEWKKKEKETDQL